MTLISPRARAARSRFLPVALRLRQWCGGAILLALGGATAYEYGPMRFEQAVGIEAVVVERRLSQPGEDASLVIDQLACQLLSPANIQAAIRDIRPGDAGLSGQELAELAERGRSQLQIDVEPGGDKQPWTIAIRSRPTGEPREAAALVNAMAEQYCRSHRQSLVEEAIRRLSAAQASRSEAEVERRQAEDQLDQQFEEFIKIKTAAGAVQLNPNPLPSHSGADAEDAPSAAAALPDAAAHRQLMMQLAELETRRTVLLERLLPAHPDVKSLDGEIAALHEQIGQLPAEAAPSKTHASEETQLGQAGTQTESELGALSAEAAHAAARIAAQRQQLKQLEDRETACLAAERKAAERLTAALTDRSIRFIPAVAKDVVPAVSGLKAICFGLLAVIAGWLLAGSPRRDKAVFQSIDDIERKTGLPVVAVLSLGEEQPDRERNQGDAKGSNRRRAG